MATKTAVEMAADIRRVEYAVHEAENIDTLNTDFTSSQELAEFWNLLGDLDIQVGSVATRYETETGNKFADLTTDII